MPHMHITPQAEETSYYAFKYARALGVFSDDMNHPHFAGNYQFMGCGDRSGLMFRNIITGQFVNCHIARAA